MMRTVLARLAGTCRYGFPGLALMLAACGAPKELSVDHAYVRLSAVKANPAAAYFTIHGGAVDRRLIAVTADVAVRAEMHETMRSPAPGGSGASMATMTPVASLPVPAHADVAFAPGGRHVMLFDVNPGIKPGATVTLTLSFADGQRVTARVPAIGAGDPVPEA